MVGGFEFIEFDGINVGRKFGVFVGYCEVALVGFEVGFILGCFVSTGGRKEKVGYELGKCVNGINGNCDGSSVGEFDNDRKGAIVGSMFGI